MVQQAFNRDTNNRALSLIHEGMAVYDRNDHHIGNVRGLYMGAASETANARGVGASTAPEPVNQDNSFVQNLARALGDDADMPEELRQRLLHDGFVRIDTDGLFSSDRYVLPDQIASVGEDRVVLRVKGSELIKRFTA